MSHRPDQLQAFLQRVLAARGLSTTGSWHAITGDASFRHFFRVGIAEQNVPLSSLGAANSFVLVDAPPETENNAQYLRIAQRWRAQGLPLPEIIASDLDQGFFAVADFGDRLLGDVLLRENPHTRYRQALDLLLRIQALPIDDTCPPYEMSRFRMELGIFREWFLDKLLAYELNAVEQRLMNDTEATLLAVIERQHRVCVHRDFHSRNLLVLPNNELGIIDFQDALYGPYAYDVVSLLRDCYVRWPDDDVANWRRYYAERAAQQLPSGALNDFTTDFDFTGMQRHLKAIGIFARLWVRNRRAGYLPDIPRVLGYLTDVSANYSLLANFADWLHTTVAPRFAARAATIVADTALK